jgi:Ni/Co efflux regulator RcnB
MKKLILLLALMAFVAAAPLAMAQKSAKKAPKIHCCIKGKCHRVTKAYCEKKKGQEVTECKECKAKSGKAVKTTK